MNCDIIRNCDDPDCMQQPHNVEHPMCLQNDRSPHRAFADDDGTMARFHAVQALGRERDDYMEQCVTLSALVSWWSDQYASMVDRKVRAEAVCNAVKALSDADRGFNPAVILGVMDAFKQWEAIDTSPSLDESALADELRQLRADRAELLAARAVCEAWERSSLPAPQDGSGRNFIGLQPFYEALDAWRALRTSNPEPRTEGAEP